MEHVAATRRQVRYHTVGFVFVQYTFLPLHVLSYNFGLRLCVLFGLQSAEISGSSARCS